MRRILLLVTVALVMAAMMVVMAMPAFADHGPHPFCGSGNEFAQEHIRVMAQNETPGLTGPPTPRPPVPATEHAPGEHQGFSVCDPAGHAGS
jgi:hypothetical protein